MTYELWTLVYLVMYLMLLGYIPGFAAIKANDVINTKNFNRDDLSPLSGKGARADRAIKNLYENLPAYTVLILLVHVTNAYNDMTALGASLFLGARLAHPVFYILGRPFLRSFSYGVGTAGILILLSQLI